MKSQNQLLSTDQNTPQVRFHPSVNFSGRSIIPQGLANNLAKSTSRVANEFLKNSTSIETRSSAMRIEEQQRNKEIKKSLSETSQAVKSHNQVNFHRIIQHGGNEMVKLKDLKQNNSFGNNQVKLQNLNSQIFVSTSPAAKHQRKEMISEAFHLSKPSSTANSRIQIRKVKSEVSSPIFIKNNEFDPFNSIRDNLILTAVKEMKEAIDERISVPKALEQNTLIWSKTMLKMKPLQKLISNFTDQVRKIVHRELNTNHETIQKYLKTTRKPDESLDQASKFIEQIAGPYQRQKSTVKKEQPSSPSNQEKVKTNESDVEGITDDESMYKKRNGEKELDIAKLADMCSSKKTLFMLIKKYLVPPGTIDVLVPTDDWMMKLAQEQSGNLLSFSYKKQVIEKIKGIIEDEIYQKSINLQITTDLQRIGNQVNFLEQETKDMLKEDDKDTPYIIQQLKLISKIDTVKAQQMCSSKAIEFMVKWGNEPVDSFKETVEDWQKIWQENKELERLIMDEAKGYQIEYQNLQARMERKVEMINDRFMFYIEAHEKAYNDKQFYLFREINQLKMEVEDFHAGKMREQLLRNEMKSSSAITDFLENPKTFKSVGEAQQFIKSLRIEVRLIQDSYNEQFQENKRIKGEVDDLTTLKNGLQKQKEAGEKIMQQLYQIASKASVQTLPRPLMTAKGIKQLSEALKFQDMTEFQNVCFDTEVLQTISKELEMAKYFSIATFSISEIMREVGIYGADVNDIAKRGQKAFQFSKNQLTELIQLFERDRLKSLTHFLLIKKDEMNQFRKKTDEVKKQKTSIIGGDSLSLAEYTRKINERYEKIPQDDKQLDKEKINSILQHCQESLKNKAQTTQTYIELCDVLNRHCTSEFSSKVLRANKLKLCDMLIVGENQIRIDEKCFSIFLSEMTNMSSNMSEGGVMLESVHSQIGFLVNSIFSINQFIHGMLDNGLIPNPAKTFSEKAIKCNLMDYSQYDRMKNALKLIQNSTSKRKIVDKLINIDDVARSFDNSSEQNNGSDRVRSRQGSKIMKKDFMSEDNPLRASSEDESGELEEKKDKGNTTSSEFQSESFSESVERPKNATTSERRASMNKISLSRHDLENDLALFVKEMVLKSLITKENSLSYKLKQLKKRQTTGELSQLNKTQLEDYNEREKKALELVGNINQENPHQNFISSNLLHTKLDIANMKKVIQIKGHLVSELKDVARIFEEGTIGDLIQQHLKEKINQAIKTETKKHKMRKKTILLGDDLSQVNKHTEDEITQLIENDSFSDLQRSGSQSKSVNTSNRHGSTMSIRLKSGQESARKPHPSNVNQPLVIDRKWLSAVPLDSSAELGSPKRRSGLNLRPKNDVGVQTDFTLVQDSRTMENTLDGLQRGMVSRGGSSLNNSRFIGGNAATPSKMSATQAYKSNKQIEVHRKTMFSDMNNPASDLMSLWKQLDIDTTLQSESLQIFPQQKKLKIEQYKAITKNLDKIGEYSNYYKEAQINSKTPKLAVQSQNFKSFYKENTQKSISQSFKSSRPQSAYILNRKMIMKRQQQEMSIGYPINKKKSLSKTEMRIGMKNPKNHTIIINQQKHIRTRDSNSALMLQDSCLNDQTSLEQDTRYIPDPQTRESMLNGCLESFSHRKDNETPEDRPTPITSDRFKQANQKNSNLLQSIQPDSSIQRKVRTNMSKQYIFSESNSVIFGRNQPRIRGSTRNFFMSTNHTNKASMQFNKVATPNGVQSSQQINNMHPKIILNTSTTLLNQKEQSGQRTGKIIQR